jgi:hypothetical protein
MPGTLTAHDMSWLRLQRGEFSPQTNCEVSFTFGVDSFVRRSFSEREGETHKLVFALRISTGYRHCSFRIEWCTGCISAMMLMDPFWRRISFEVRTRLTVPSDYRAAAYQELLLVANSAKKDG